MFGLGQPLDHGSRDIPGRSRRFLGRASFRRSGGGLPGGLRRFEVFPSLSSGFLRRLGGRARFFQGSLGRPHLVFREQGPHRGFLYFCFQVTHRSTRFGPSSLAFSRHDVCLAPVSRLVSWAEREPSNGGCR